MKEIEKVDVTVVIPVYNREDVIIRAVNSMLNQTFDGTFSIIVVDDGSTDNTIKCLTHLEDKITIICQKNAGAYAARMAGVAAANSDFVTFLDSDDIAEPHMIQSLYDSITQSPEIALSYGLVGDLKGNYVQEQNVPQVNDQSILENPLKALLDNGCFTYSMNLMTRKEYAVKAGHKRQHMLAANDYDFCLRLSAFGKFSFVNKITLLIERRDDGISAKFGYRQVYFAIIAATEAVEKRKNIDSNFQDLRDSLKRRLATQWTSAFGQLFFKKEFKKALEVLMIGMKYGSWGDIKKLYWSIDYHAHQKK